MLIIFVSTKNVFVQNNNLSLFDLVVITNYLYQFIPDAEHIASP